MKRVIATTEMYGTSVSLEMESYDDALEFCDDNNLPHSAVTEVDGEYYVECKEYSTKKISAYYYTFKIFKKFGKDTSQYVSTVRNYKSQCNDYTSLNKEYISRAGLPRNYFIYKPSLEIMKTDASYEFDHYGM